MIKTVGQLIAALKQKDPEAKIISPAPPFEGVRLVDQESGAVLICQPKAEASE